MKRQRESKGQDPTNTAKHDARHLMAGSRFRFNGREYKAKAVEKANGSVYVTCSDGTTFDFSPYQDVDFFKR